MTVNARLLRLLPLVLALLAGRAEAADAAVAPTFAKLYEATLQTNPVLKGREFSVDQAVAQKDIVRSRLLPQLSAVGNYSWNDYRDRLVGEQAYDGKRGTVQARQALLDLASYFRLQGAKYTILQSEQEADAIRAGLAGEVLDRYLLVLQAADDLGFVQAEKHVIATQLKRLRVMRDRQLVKITDLYEVEAYYEGLLTREIEVRNAEAVARERLRETTGVAVSGLPPMERQDFAPPPGRDNEWVGDAVERNPSLAALKYAIEAAREIVASTRSEHVPQVALVLSDTYSDQGYDNRKQPPYWVGTVGVQVTIPIYEGGRAQGGVNDAVARYEIARQQYEAARREIERETRTAYLGAVASHSRIASTRREVESLEKAADAQTKMYERGLTTVIDLLDVRQRLVKSRSAQSKARYDYLRDLTSLRIRAGRFGSDDIEQLNRWLLEPSAVPAAPDGGQPAVRRTTAAAAPNGRRADVEVASLH